AFIHSVVERWRGATMGNKRKLGDVAAEAGKPSAEWGAFVTEAEQPLLAAATRPIGRESGTLPAGAVSALRASLMRK
ncbi:MAG: hypothetical protein WAO08_07905, partial [Hyphomicrobiaceae bacterium]